MERFPDELVNIKTMPLLEYRNATNKWCECK